MDKPVFFIKSKISNQTKAIFIKKNKNSESYHRNFCYTLSNGLKEKTIPFTYIRFKEEPEKNFISCFKLY